MNSDDHDPGEHDGFDSDDADSDDFETYDRTMRMRTMASPTSTGTRIRPAMGRLLGSMNEGDHDEAADEAGDDESDQCDPEDPPAIETYLPDEFVVFRDVCEPGDELFCEDEYWEDMPEDEEDEESELEDGSAENPFKMKRRVP